MLLFVLIIFVSACASSHSSLLLCDFETPCQDFSTDSSWGVTDGLHPRPLDHDHTLKNSSGQYLFFIPKNGSRVPLAEIRTGNWLHPPTDRAICFQLWYYATPSDLTVSIQLLQGDDEKLSRVAASIFANDPTVTDWTFVQVPLPAEQIRVVIRLNATAGVLTLDDLSVDFCDQPPPAPRETLLECDFESSCTDSFVSLPNYPYQWSTVQASDAVKNQSQAPAVDYTFGNRSGHYAWLGSDDRFQSGNVGYLATRTVFNITADQSYCVSLQYYNYRQSFSGNLLIYTMGSEGVQRIWPMINAGSFSYIKDKWTWAVMNLPVGDYSLLFRADNTDIGRSSFALDNIAVTSCDYAPYPMSPFNTVLSFACDFDNLTMCGMVNGNQFSSPTFNFSVVTGEAVPHPELGPTRDHTTNSSSGAFLYWERERPFIPSDYGDISPSTRIEANLGMCIRFAYFVNSTAVNKNGTTLSVSASGCYGGNLWMQSMDSSEDWQVVTIPAKGFACAETFYFHVTQKEPVAVSVAFDDVEIAQCSSFDPPTTTTSTTTSSTTTSSPTTTTSTSTSTTTSVTTVTTSTSVTSTTSTVPTTTSPTSSSTRFEPIGRRVLLILCFLLLALIRS